MTDHPQLDSAAAVRLARFAVPGRPWTNDGWMDGVAATCPGPDYDYDSPGDNIIFDPNGSLDSTALAEQRVVAAGPPGAHFLHTYAQQLCWHLDALRRPDQLIAFMDAPQRARALIQLLDQHPELEREAREVSK